MIIYLLLLGIIFESSIIFLAFKDFIAPAFVFNITFLMATLNYITNYNKWGSQASLDFVLIVFIGITVYSLTSIISEYMVSKFFSNNRYKTIGRYNTPEIKVRNAIVILFIAFEIIISILFAKYLISVTAKYGTDGTLSSAVSMYQYLSKFTTVHFNIPSYVIYGYIIVTSSGYVWGYILENNYLYNKKVNLWILIAFLISIVSSLLTGSRGEVIHIIVTMIIFYVVKKKLISSQKSIKTFINIVIIMIMLTLSFEGVAKLLGRDASLNMYDYISVYLGAPLENFNNYLKTFGLNGLDVTSIPGANTFRTQINWINSYRGLDGQLTVLNPIMQYSNGYNLGNVFTTFKFFYADAGIYGIIIFTAIMALIVQVLYSIIKRLDLNEGKVRVSFLIYGYLFTGAMLSFFSNRFYESITIVFIERIICWIALCCIVVKSQNVLGGNYGKIE